jgi:ABC-type transporter Mla MlaB component
MFRIEKRSDGDKTTLRISGRVESEQLLELRAHIDRCVSLPRLDLEELNLVDLAAIRFLIRCHAEGMTIVHCPLYIQEWMFREERRSSL